MAVQTQTPKSKLVETASELIHRQGWNATGINQILGEAKVPKGSFYYYFQSKEDLGVAIVRYQALRLQESYGRTLLNTNLSGRDAVQSYFAEAVERQRSGFWALGCPIGNLSSEVAGSTEKITCACRDGLLEWVAALEAAIERGQTDKSIIATEPADRLAQFVASEWQGSLVFMKTFKTDSYLRDSTSFIFNKLFGQQ